MVTKTIQASTLELRQLIDGCVTGKADYQKMLYDYYAPTMFGICQRYSKDFHQAEDLLQEGFIKVFNKIHQFKHQGSFEGWLKRIFINISIENIRKKQSFFALLPNDTDKSTIEPDIIDSLATQDLLKCIQKLPDGYRTIFNLYIIEGYNHQEISKLLNISVGTSKSQLSRARTHLQNIIKTVYQHG